MVSVTNLLNLIADIVKNARPLDRTVHMVMMISSIIIKEVFLLYKISLLKSL